MLEELQQPFALCTGEQLELDQVQVKTMWLCLTNSFTSRLFSLKLLKQQVRDLIDHEDSPYIRAVGDAFSTRCVAFPNQIAIGRSC